MSTLFDFLAATAVIHVLDTPAAKAAGTPAPTPRPCACACTSKAA